MPKIQADSVAEHRAHQRAALLRAARDVIRSDGASALTVGAVARRTGLARNSVYKYFSGRDELIAAVVAETVPVWLDRIEREMAAADDPRGRVAAHVRAQLELVRDGEHRIARALAEDPDARARMADARHAHAELLRPLTRVLTDLGDPDPTRTALLVQGIVNAATTALEDGDDYRSVTSRATALAVSAVIP